MPIYEYHCNDCNGEFSELILNLKEAGRVRCKYCNGRSLSRLVSSFSVHQSEGSRLANFDTSKPQGDSFYKDPRNVGLWARKRTKELGIDLGPRMDEIVERGRTGKILEDYEK